MANSIVGLEVFLRNWRTVPEKQELLPVLRGPRGHVNLTGAPEAPSITFTKYHAQFVESLEEGVRDLVLCVIKILNCVTYSSCEGHLTEDGTGILCGRHVAIICQDADERSILRRRIENAIALVRHPRNAIHLTVHEEDLESETSSIQTLNLIFLPTTNKPEEYFEELKDVCEEFMLRIAQC